MLLSGLLFISGGSHGATNGVIERSLSKEIDNGWGVESPRYPVAVVVQLINEVDDTLGCCSQVLSKFPVLYFSQPALFEANWQSQCLISNA